MDIIIASVLDIYCMYVHPEKAGAKLARMTHTSVPEFWNFGAGKSPLMIIVVVVTQSCVFWGSAIVQHTFSRTCDRDKHVQGGEASTWDVATPSFGGNLYEVTVRTDDIV